MKGKTEVQTDRPEAIYHPPSATSKASSSCISFWQTRWCWSIRIGDAEILSESAKSQYLNEDLCKSLIIMRENQIEEERSNSVLQRKLLPGYMQRITAHPFSVMCYTETGISIWHTNASSCVVFCDATGSLASMRSKVLPTGSSRTL